MNDVALQLGLVAGHVANGLTQGISHHRKACIYGLFCDGLGYLRGVTASCQLKLSVPLFRAEMVRSNRSFQKGLHEGPWYG